MTLDRVRLGGFLEFLEAEDADGGWTCVGEEGIDDQVGRGVEVAMGTRHVSKDAAFARHECLLGGPPTTSRPGDGMELKEPRYLEE